MSKLTKEDILRDAKEKNVEFVRLQFTDVFGLMKNVAVTVSQQSAVKVYPCKKNFVFRFHP